MSVGKIFEGALTLGPVALVACICLESRLYSDAFQPVTYTPAQEQAVSAYIQPVKETLKAQIKTAPMPIVRSVASIWVDGSKDGSLKALIPSSPDDNLRSPLKSQIYLACGSVVARLESAADAEWRSGKKELAASDYLSALQVCEVLKYSDPTAVAMFSVRESGIMEALNADIGNCSAAVRRQIRTGIQSFADNQVPMSTIFRNLKTVYGIEDERSVANETASEDPEAASEVGIMEDPLSEKAAIQQVDKHRTKPSGGHVSAESPFLMDFDLAYKSQARELAGAKALLSRIDNSAREV